MTATILDTGPKSMLRSPSIHREVAGVPAAGKLQQYIGYLERACADNPNSADLHTCLGMAHAENEALYPAKSAYEAALALDPKHFFARLRYAELCCRVGAYPRARLEADHASGLVRNGWESAMVRRLFEEIQQRERFEENGSAMVLLRRPVAIFIAIVATVTVTLLAV